MRARSVVAVLAGCVATVSVVVGAAARWKGLPVSGPAPGPCTVFVAGDKTCVLNSGLATFSLWPHLVSAGGVITGRVTIHLKGTEWKWGTVALGKPRTRCRDNIDTSCSWRVSKSAADGFWHVAIIGLGPRAAESRDYYAVLGPGERAITGTVENQSGRPLPGQRVTVRGGSAKSLVTDHAGVYNALVSPGRYTVTLAGNTRRVSCSGSRQGKACVLDVAHRDGHADFVVTTEPTTFKAQNPRSPNKALLFELIVGQKIDYEGSGWDAHGDPITISLEGRALTTLPAAGTFKGTFTLPAWQGSDCKGMLEARQGEFTEQTKLFGEQQATARVQGNVALSGKGTLKDGAAICAGELFEQLPAQGPPVRLGFDQLLGHVSVATGGSLVVGQLVVARPQGKGEIVWYGRVAGRPCTFQLPAPKKTAACLESDRREAETNVKQVFDAPRENLQILPAGQHTSLLLEGRFVSKGDVTVTGSLSLAGERNPNGEVLPGGILAVDGNLTVGGGVRGVGEIYATGRVVIRGGVHLGGMPFAAVWDVHDAIVAGGPLTIRG